ncbi:MAG: FAD:protein FMN transferase [Bdellovibrionales bacterium]|nr:FAD:protein FMN transferase [Bdellovibrionales bacterium]
MRPIFTLLFCLGPGLCLWPCWGASLKEASLEKNPPLACHEFVEMGTLFKICLYPPEKLKKNIHVHFQRSEQILASINHWMSDWLSESELSQVNEFAGIKAVKVRKELFDIIKTSIDVGNITEGAFDISFNAFWGLYRFKKGEEKFPTDLQIQERLPLVNYKNIQLDEKARSVFLTKKRMKIGLGGIGQGYGVDRVVDYLKGKGFTSGFVDGSGDTSFWGLKPNGELWTTGVRDPFNHDKIVALIAGTDFAITTAGDDEKFFFQDGKRIHHILDPKTGKSSTASRQATVIAKCATRADAFDTASFVLGPSRAKAILEAQGLQGVLIGHEEGDVVFTSGLEKKKTPWGEVLQLK